MSVKPKNPSFSRRKLIAATPAIALGAALGNRAHAQSIYDLPDASQAWQTFTPTALPPLVFQDETGKQLTINDYKGHVLLVNLWATWCPPCKLELPTLAALAPKMQSFGGLILPISIDQGGADVVKSYFAEHSIRTLPVLTDSSGGDLNLLQSPGIPVTVIVRPDGLGVAQLTGGAGWDNSSVLSFLRNLASAKPAASGGIS